jgi:hypothetical protein
VGEEIKIFTTGDTEDGGKATGCGETLITAPLVINLACLSTLVKVGEEIKIFTTGDTELVGFLSRFH